MSRHVVHRQLGVTDEYQELPADEALAPESVTVTFPDGSQRKKTFTIDTINSPKTMDLLSHDGQEKGQAAACIYKVEPGRLTICLPYFTDIPNQRPREFKTTENDAVNIVFVYERLK